MKQVNFHKRSLLKFCLVHRNYNDITMGVWNQIAQYLFLKKKDPNAPDSNWIRKMHGINRISIYLFLIAIIIIIVKLIRKH